MKLTTVVCLLFASALSVTAAPQPASLSKLRFPPSGFRVASSSADHEKLSQKGPCTACGIPTIKGPHNMKKGVYTAAGGPSIFGKTNSCGACGDCYEVHNTGHPFCTNCGGKTQSGPRKIMVMITNQCTDCTKSRTKAGHHFDILNPPSGWDNPNVFYKKVSNRACLK